MICNDVKSTPNEVNVRVYFVKVSSFKCSFEAAERGFYRAANSVFIECYVQPSIEFRLLKLEYRALTE